MNKQTNPRFLGVGDRVRYAYRGGKKNISGKIRFGIINSLSRFGYVSVRFEDSGKLQNVLISNLKYAGSEEV